MARRSSRRALLGKELTHRQANIILGRVLDEDGVAFAVDGPVVRLGTLDDGLERGRVRQP